MCGEHRLPDPWAILGRGDPRSLVMGWLPLKEPRSTRRCLNGGVPASASQTNREGSPDGSCNTSALGSWTGGSENTYGSRRPHRLRSRQSPRGLRTAAAARATPSPGQSTGCQMRCSTENSNARPVEEQALPDCREESGRWCRPQLAAVRPCCFRDICAKNGLLRHGHCRPATCGDVR